MRTIVLLLCIPFVCAKAVSPYLPIIADVDYRERLTLPHVYPGYSTTSGERFLAEPLKPSQSTVRWTAEGAYGIHLDKIHLMRGTYTLRIKSTKGWEIRFLPFDTTKIYLRPDYYRVEYDKETFTVWVGKYAD